MAKQNEFTEGFSQNVDLRQREDEIVSHVQAEMHFEPDEIISRSTWWGSERTGAFQCAGTYEGKPAILKIQGVEPSSSEIEALKSVNSAATNATVRAPFLYVSLPWDSSNGFEALIVERIRSDKLIHLPSTPNEVSQFFKLYEDYAANLRPQPWIDKPTESLAGSVKRSVEGQLKIVNEIYPDHPLRQPGDTKLIESAIAVVCERYQGAETYFQHCHISSDDVFMPNGDDARYVYTSNFVWAWKPKFYDALAAYHHFPRLLIDRSAGLTAEVVDEQTGWWISEIEKLPKDDSERSSLHTVMLELAIYRLVIDDLTLDPKNPLAHHLIQTTRNTIQSLLQELADS